MKFQGKKSNLVEHSQTEFLTFRYNQTEIFQSTGRSVASQKIEYRSLQKYPMHEFSVAHKISEEQVANQPNNAQAVEFVHKNPYKKKLANVRSQQRIIADRRPEPNDPFGHNAISQQPFPSLEESSIEINTEARNEILRKKLDRLVRNLKKEQRKQLSLEKQLQSCQQELEEFQREYMEQEDSIAELDEIQLENTQECERLGGSLENAANDNQELQEQILELESALHSEGLQGDISKNTNLIQNLNEQIRRVELLKQQIISRAEKLQKQVRNMQDWLERTADIDELIISQILGRQLSKNSSKDRLKLDFSNGDSLRSKD